MSLQNTTLSVFEHPYTPIPGYQINDYCFTRFKSVVDKSLGDCKRVFAFRVDLRFPTGVYVDESRVMDKFIASLKAKINHSRKKRLDVDPYARTTKLRYCWAREESVQSGQSHYHLFMLVNKNVFNSLGVFELGRDNMYNRLVEAWGSALGIGTYDAFGLVHIPNNHGYHLDQRSDGFYADLSLLLTRLSYLAKLETKENKCSRNSFGCSVS